MPPASLTPADRLAAVALERLVAVRALTAPGPTGPPGEAVTEQAQDASGDLLAELDRALESARKDFTESLGEAHALSVVVARAALTDLEAEVLAVAVAVESQEYLRQLVVSLTGDRERHRLEIGVLSELFGADHPGPSVAGPRSGLQAAALVSVQPAGAFGRAAICVDERVMWALSGDRQMDPALPIDTEIQRSDVRRDDVSFTAVLVSGTDRVRRHELAKDLLGMSFSMIVPAPAAMATVNGVQVTASSASVDSAWAAIVREATLTAAAVIVDVDGALDAIGRRWIERATHLRWALSSTAPVDIRELPRLDWREFEAPATEPTDEEWAAAVGADTPRSHHLTADQLDQTRIAMAAHDGDFAAAFKRLVSPKLNALASHIRPRHTWEDLILSPAHEAQLRDLVSRYHLAHRVYDEWGFPAVPSRGLVALFSGPSGTGKTLAAEVVAGQLGLDLYKLNLSSVVSKYIGETEKNLDGLFDAAGTGNFVLFFDEADSLFGKRGEVSDATDRYANIETSYLLQRLEKYDGVVVMATNFEKNIDPAFLRRIHVRVDFAAPTEPERLLIWQRHSRAGVQLSEDVDFAWLAKRFDIPGAAIRNAIVDAAFLAAAVDSPIDMASLVRGVARELRKLGRLVTRDTFGAWFETAARATGGAV